jgi:hypothetical protein
MEVTLPSFGLTSLSVFAPHWCPFAFAKEQVIVAIAGALSSAALLFALAKPTYGRG